MRDLTREWSSHGARHGLTVRLWWHGNPLRDLCRWLRGRAPWWTAANPPTEFRLFSTPHAQQECYCPEGSETEIRLVLFGVGLWAWLSRSRVRRPCWCDVVCWAFSPDAHADDIEDAGGWEALCGRFPDLRGLLAKEGGLSR